MIVVKGFKEVIGVLMIVSVAVFLIFAVRTIYSSGYDSGIAIKQLEIDRMREANEKAIRDASELQDALREQIREQFISSQNMLEQLRNEADNDPDADSCGLGASSVYRLNSIR